MSSFGKIGSGSGAGGSGTVSKGATNMGPPLRLQSPCRFVAKRACLPPKFHSPQRMRRTFKLQGGGDDDIDPRQVRCPNDGPDRVKADKCTKKDCPHMHWCSCKAPLKIREGVYMHARGGSAAGGGWVLREYFGEYGGRRKVTCFGKDADNDRNTKATSAAATKKRHEDAEALTPVALDVVLTVPEKQTVIRDILQSDVFQLLGSDDAIVIFGTGTTPVGCSLDTALDKMWVELMKSFTKRGGELQADGSRVGGERTALA